MLFIISQTTVVHETRSGGNLYLIRSYLMVVENLHYIINHSFNLNVCSLSSPAGLSPRHELDFASLTFWTRLCVVHGV